MSKYKAICITVKCKCGEEIATLVPLEISEADWRKTREKYGEMIIENF
jgi:hypothetical protein